MLDILPTIEVTIGSAIVVCFLAFALGRTVSGRLGILGGLGAWFALVVAIGAAGALDPQGGLGAPGLGAVVALPVITLVGAYLAVPSLRSALARPPLEALIAVNAIRVIGVSFVIAYAAGRLPAPFAPSAGWGDIFIGATALPLAWAATRSLERVRGLVWLWNAMGMVDLLSAIALGTLSAPGPLQVFAGPPTSAMMTTLPWLIIPGFLVPTFIFIHVVIFYRLAKRQAAAPAARPQHALPLMAHSRRQPHSTAALD